jgi:hypothetical protein
MGAPGHLREMVEASLDGAGKWQVGGTLLVVFLSTFLAGWGEHLVGHTAYSALVETGAKIVDLFAGAVLIWLVLVGTPAKKLAFERKKTSVMDAERQADRQQIMALQAEVAALRAQNAAPPPIIIHNLYAVGNEDALRKLLPWPGQLPQAIQPQAPVQPAPAPNLPQPLPEPAPEPPPQGPAVDDVEAHNG